MSPLVKFLIGLLGVGLVTWLSLGPFGQAQTIADDLESRTRAALEAEGAVGVEVRVPRHPVSRTIHLTGSFPNDLKRRMREIALAQRGVFGVMWDDSAEDDNAATARAAADCQAQLNALVSQDTIQFRSGSPYINPASARLLDRISEAARDCRGVRIEIAGHSDRSGRENVNLELSGNRAVAVRDALVERGLPADMLRTVGKGSSEPLGDNPADPANRRIEFTVTVPGEGDG